MPIRIMDGLGSKDMLNIERISKAIRGIDQEHAKSHDGKAFSSSDCTIVPANGSYYYLMQNPSGNFPHVRVYTVTSSQAPTVITLLEGTTWTGSGTNNLTFNNNRNSINTPNLIVTGSPIITNDGTELECNLIVGEKRTGGNVFGAYSEWILIPGSNYAVKINNNTAQAGSITFNMFWYE